MEAASQRVRVLTQQILRERPYTLSLSIDRRYRVLVEKDNFFEEWQQQRLQYYTLVFDGDRGICYTRPSYDMREEPSSTHGPRAGATTSSTTGGGNTNQPAAGAGAAERKNVTKLSLSDYKNKLKKSSLSPPEQQPPSSLAAANARMDKDKEKDRDKERRGPAPEPKKAEEHPLPRKLVDGKHRDALGITIEKPSRHRDMPEEERPRKPQLKEASGYYASDPVDRKKRVADSDANNFPLKRSKADADAVRDDRSRTPREAPRERPSSAQDRTPQREAKKESASGASTTLTNGRSILKAAASRDAGSSPPVSRHRGDSVNGHHKHNSTSSSKNTPIKIDTAAAASSRTQMPTLISPLRIDIDTLAREKRKRGDDDDEPIKPHKSHHKSDQPPPAKKPKIPPLLSPTLPAIVEEELARLKKTPTKKSDGTAGSKSTPLSEPPSSGKKPREPPAPERLIVTLKYSKRLAKSVQRLLAITQKDRKERSVSTEAAPQPPARKRPLPSGGDVVGDSIAVKRPRTSDTNGPQPTSSSSRLNAPSTPMPPSNRSGTAMTRVGSNNSQAHTPGDANSLTPGGPPPPASQERPPTSSNALDKATLARIQLLREKYKKHLELGTHIKHERDAVLKKKGPPRPSSAPAIVSDADKKLGALLGLECVMAFMVAFRAQTEWRHLEKKGVDPRAWESTLGILLELGFLLRPSRGLYAAGLQLRALCLEEMVQCYWYLEGAQSSALIKLEKERAEVWRNAHTAMLRVELKEMRVQVGPWMSVEEAATAFLKVLSRFADDEGVEWKPELSFTSTSTVNGS